MTTLSTVKDAKCSKSSQTKNPIKLVIMIIDGTIAKAEILAT